MQKQTLKLLALPSKALPMRLLKLLMRLPMLLLQPQLKQRPKKLLLLSN